MQVISCQSFPEVIAKEKLTSSDISNEENIEVERYKGMEILFLYDRLLDISRQQLEALKKKDLELVERLTEQREEVTGRIISIMESKDFGSKGQVFHRKAHEYTENILAIDEEIRSLLLDELYEHALKLSRLELLKEEL